MSAFALVDRISGIISLIAAQVAVVILVGVTGLILTEIVLRSFFGSTTQIVEEYVAYGLGTMVFLGLAQAMRTGSLVRVDIVLGKLGPEARRWFEIAGCAVTLIVMTFVVYYVSISLGRDFARGTISMTRAATPIWIPNGVVCAGMVIFMLQVTVYMISVGMRGPLIKDDVPVE